MPDSTLDLTRDLADLATLATSDEADLDDMLRRGLDWLAKLAPYDLACVFQLEGDQLVVRAMRGPLARAEVRSHRLDLDAFPTIREALETRRARAYTEDDHAHGDGDPFDGVIDLPAGHACMVVPLAAGERAFGVLSLDRRECVTYPQAVVDLVEIYGRILALAIRSAEQSASLARLGAQSREHARLLEERIEGGEEGGVLETSASPAVRELARKARQVAATTTPVLILGETGTGKERLAHAIHRWSARRDRPFVVVNCAAIPEGLLESELFGHDRGAFTGATRERSGRFRTANGGTLFLDEIGELPLELQAKLLRVLQTGELQSVGSDRTIKVDVRIVAATHVDLARAVEEGRFREDLYYRLDVFPLRLPALRERLEDLPALCEHLLADQRARTGRRGVHATREAIEALARHRWPGNIRELANVLERAAILSASGALGPVDLGMSERAPVSTKKARGGDGELVSLAENERRHIAAVLRATEGRIYGERGAAKILGVPPSTLQSRMKKLGLDPAGAR
ncbi:sigma 54-interacting transcriptional regulator [Sandaracinus amylolyticus]|uniref:sigma 54-interacting transcriptional regulator n=1 Tax=Sandaracinus amylolyticus TaxID=927083 RepID=UPI001F0021E1|nr:sigma 54-interacting transcriptional regulator [Sandaracinus amylolyticus]UJR82009.1 Formate hydrogenlyase transcriptional activator [Sandaracinus amylolyticus]